MVASTPRERSRAAAAGRRSSAAPAHAIISGVANFCASSSSSPRGGVRPPELESDSPQSDSSESLDDGPNFSTWSSSRASAEAAGAPPGSVTLSLVPRANPAPLTMQPMEPASAT